MEIVDNKNGIPLEHYKELFAQADPLEMSARRQIGYEDGVFTTVLLGRKVCVTWPEMKVTYEDGSEAAKNIQILLGRTLMEGALIPAQGQMLAYNDLPWGNVYLTQFRGRCVQRMVGTYGYCMPKFAPACESVGGVPVKGGDTAFDIPFLPGLTVRLIMWEGDEEFPPAGQALFSDNFSAAFSTEDVAVVGDVLLNAMKGRW